MKQITLDISKISPFVKEDEINFFMEQHKDIFSRVHSSKPGDTDVLGWIEPDSGISGDLILQIQQKAEEIKNADVFLLIGVGGSNNAARCVIEALGSRNKPEIIYAGNNLSAAYLSEIMSRLDGKSVYANVIAKNFATFEPGIHFRVIRQYMEKTYGVEEAARRIIATASLNDSSLEKLAKEKGYTLLPFPLDAGGRFSALTAVGLFPMAVAGINIREILQGSEEMRNTLRNDTTKNIAVQYGAIRNLLYSKGYNTEILSYFESQLTNFAKWWVQLFGESEGKEGKGIYPTSCSFSEDLHSMGQYIQQGRRTLLETFINIEDTGAELILQNEENDIDLFNFLSDMNLDDINRTAFDATLNAHCEGGVPCMVINVPKLTPYYLGQLFYMFMYSCYISAEILGVDPFDQPGVEAYKSKMIEKLKK